MGKTPSSGGQNTQRVQEQRQHRRPRQANESGWKKLRGIHSFGQAWYPARCTSTLKTGKQHCQLAKKACHTTLGGTDTAQDFSGSNMIRCWLPACSIQLCLGGMPCILAATGIQVVLGRQISAPLTLFLATAQLCQLRKSSGPRHGPLTPSIVLGTSAPLTQA